MIDFDHFYSDINIWAFDYRLLSSIGIIRISHLILSLIKIFFYIYKAYVIVFLKIWFDKRDLFFILKNIKLLNV